MRGFRRRKGYLVFVVVVVVGGGHTHVCVYICIIGGWMDRWSTRLIDNSRLLLVVCLVIYHDHHVT